MPASCSACTAPRTSASTAAGPAACAAAVAYPACGAKKPSVE